MRISTRGGDEGTTDLPAGGRVWKDAARMEALGVVDELNATLGAVRCADAASWLTAEMATIQTRLLLVGAELATAGVDAPAGRERLGDDDVAALERWIERLEDDLPPLERFVLPGGSALGAALHVARTVCRRAERRVVTLLRTESVDARLVRYLNRLGDLLFVMALWCNRRADVTEVEWPRRAR